MRLWILFFLVFAVFLVLDVGAKVKQPKVDKKAQKKQKKQKEQKQKHQVPNVAKPHLPDAPQFQQPPEPVKHHQHPAEPKLLKLKQSQDEQQYQRQKEQERAEKERLQQANAQAQANPETGYRPGYPYPPNGNGENGYNGYEYQNGDAQQETEQEPQEPVFIPELAKIKFYKPKHHHHHGKHDQYRGCGCAHANNAQKPTEPRDNTEQATGTKDPRVADALNDPEYMYLKMVPADELPEEGSPEAECPLLVISRKDQQFTKGCLRVLKQQVDEAVAQYEAEQRYQEPSEFDSGDEGTGSFLGDVKEAVKRAEDRQVDKLEGNDNEQPPNRRTEPKTILQANKDLETEHIGPNGYEGIGSI